MKKDENGFINELDTNEIFVFGSNTSGLHSGGAAKKALSFGAISGKASGIQGNSYAIPTVNPYFRSFMQLDHIQKHIKDFLTFAFNNPNLTFYVTDIACGIAGYKYEEIAPLFKNVLNGVKLENVYFTDNFAKYIGDVNIW